MGIEKALTQGEQEEVEQWHQGWREVPNNYMDINIPIEESYSVMLERINYYI